MNYLSLFSALVVLFVSQLNANPLNGKFILRTMNFLTDLILIFLTDLILIFLTDLILIF